MMSHLCMLFLSSLAFISVSNGLNVLMISSGAAGHVIPMFELAKAMKTHHVTFITETYAQSYINFTSYPNLSSFDLIYSNDSRSAFMDEKKSEKDILEYATNHSLFDSLVFMIPRVGQGLTGLMNKTVYRLMSERFDVVIGCSLIFGIGALCNKVQMPCVVQMAEMELNPLAINQPNSCSLLSSTQLTELKYRIYNIAFVLRMTMTIAKPLIKIFMTILQSFPQISGPFYDTFTLRNLLFTKSKCLNLFNLPPTLYPPLYSHHLTKYLGAFIDESTIDYTDNDLTRWIKSKPTDSIIYTAFGSTGMVDFDRMKNLINGLAEFLLRTDAASLILAFRSNNYNQYQMALNELKNDEYRRVLLDEQRVKVEQGFIPQKWILQQNSVHLFLSHCGMGSISEGLYFQKLFLCLPLHTDQFFNAIVLDRAGVGQSLFQPPSLFQSFQNPMDFHGYTFSASDVARKLLLMWRNDTFQNTARIISAEIKHAGGVKRAVEEIELFVKVNGNFDRYASFQSTLPVYQQYMLDLLIVFLALSIPVIFCLFVKCSKRNQKRKVE